MGKKKVEEVSQTKEEKTLAKESKRLRELALTSGLLSEKKAVPDAPMHPHSGIVRCDGKDICKKGHRKNKYLFSFPGLVAPVAVGKFGDLTQLDTKNPILYVDFLQGRLKLFGTIVYSKNKYITLNFVRGAGSIQCEDIFENLVVFSDAWWIGTKEENPDELRLEMPLDFQQERHAVYDFAGGAGKPRNIKDDVDVQDSQLELVQVSELESSKQCTPKGQLKMDRWLFQKKPSENKTLEKSFESNAKTKPKNASEWESDEDEEGFVNLGDAPTPSRQSARIAEKKHSYAESSSEENQTDGSDEHDRADAELRDPRDKTVNKLFNDVEDGFLAPESQISQMDLADLTANTIGAGSKQSSLSAFFMKSSEKNKSANVKPPAPLVEISSTRAYQKKKIVKSTLDNDDAGKEDENVTPKDEMESVLPCTPPDINDSKRKRKSTPDGKRNSRGTGGNGYHIEGAAVNTGTMLTKQSNVHNVATLFYGPQNKSYTSCENYALFFMFCHAFGK
ncbi:uncharacterized protein [Physcomitrium patens]|uniref:uncharacterized protein isoform X4 n=1 Tax=Physcomitrium patens TaxID=3218 RepID=UPI000D15EE5E|nr:DNA-binding protein RHL1-like isoform X4 [Physcomitrium patens]|eukprot:XP_024365072.1 DNA-binding protein RHL1-like isoform X4 [Physcomitrella patens]